MAAELKKTRRYREYGHARKDGRAPENFEEKPKTYAAAAAKPKPSEAVAADSWLNDNLTHTIIVSSRCANHTSDQVVSNQGGYKAGARSPLVIYPGCPENQLRSGHSRLAEGTKQPHNRRSEWEKIVARVRYRKRARNPLECHPVLEVSLHVSPHKAGHIYVGCSEDRCGINRPGTVLACPDRPQQEILPRKADKCAHCGGDHTGLFVPARKTPSPRCINCTRAGCEDVAHSAFSLVRRPSQMG
ncbi:hypothetical protein EVAR_53194_1 [Eumeta japonica]|uniref:Uncharacterized protein n=1 Tax=Eumeta variegata TaxID=151549 RepID=A0A4C1YZ22_EUMVA|nr:hypothetical protein EVAR_53194_1 [Eumeta japonica]